ncbi:hypothetical protein FBEOM_5164 [Fusarium beomiforme]|uniref:Uncharacterized protein n=1 Tax=Fusarium beomiforme TaxID=44412 RepID=A0A9P5DXE2_9HYPO|nr:hypothetical protein FBEOM_5164 [Fusarium beomiforme]
MSETNRLTSQRLSTLTHHADMMDLLSSYDEITSKLRELGIMIQERIYALDREADRAASSKSDIDMITDSLSASQPRQAGPEASVPARNTKSRTAPYPEPTPEEIAKLRARPEPVRVLEIRETKEIDAKASAKAKPKNKGRTKRKQKTKRDRRLQKLWKGCRRYSPY